MIILKENNNSITTYYVTKDVSNEQMSAKYANTYVVPNQINMIINEDADVYTCELINNTLNKKTAKLLLRFRKNKLPKAHADVFYENIIKFAQLLTSNRGSTSNTIKSLKKNVKTNPRIMSNVFGYIDGFSVSQKMSFKKRGIQTRELMKVRECSFNQDHPEKYKQTLPFLQNINNLYKKYMPRWYALQLKKAKQTHFKIPNTVFTTVTTNVNFQTTIHKDKGDLEEGFGNLAVVQNGEYTGGETCFPQYSIGVNVRTGDILFMDVHEWHGNLPIKKKSPDAKRLSVVCYFREAIWEITRGKSKKSKQKHLKHLKHLKTLKMSKLKSNAKSNAKSKHLKTLKK